MDMDVRGYGEMARIGDTGEDWCRKPGLTLGCSAQEDKKEEQETNRLSLKNRIKKTHKL